MSFFVLCGCIWLLSINLYAQREQVWAFGDHAGLDFNGPVPAPLRTSIDTREGCASICDEQGQLLFYTDGTTVWDRNDSIMPNGSDLPGIGFNITNSTVQGSLIIPMPGSSKKYYIFSLGAIESGHFGELYYSILDMDLNNGLGDLSMTGKLLDKGLTEHMTGVAGNNCDIWLLTTSATTGTLNAYRIDAAGINSNPVFSNSSGLVEKYGTLDVSPDRRRIAIAKNDLVLMDFDPETGKAANPLLLTMPNKYYGTCFSPDGSKLYTSNGPVLQQFDLSSGDTQKMKSSRMTILAWAYSMKRGPDSKMYVTAGSNGSGSTLHVINRPNLAGMDCDPVLAGVHLLPGTLHKLGLPNSVPLITNRRVYSTTTDSIFCPQPVLLTASNLSGAGYTWEDGSTGASRQVDSPGTYWLSYKVSSSCVLDDYHVDTFYIVYPEKDYEVAFSADTLICVDHQIRFENNSDGHYNSFSWSFGNGDSSMLANPDYAYDRADNYEVMLIGKINDICPDTAYQTIVVDPVISTAFTMDRDSICTGESVTFIQDMSGPTITSLQWHFGDGTSTTLLNEQVIQHAYEISGILPITLRSKFRSCPDTSFTDTAYVFALPEINLGPDKSLCSNSSPVTLRNLQLRAAGISHSWNTGDTTESLKITQAGIYSLTISSAPLACSNTASIQVTKDCYIDIPNAFSPNGDGKNDYFFPRQLLSKGLDHFKMRVFNEWGQLVFETMQTDGRGWDGKLNGKEQPVGVYIYLIEADMANERQEVYQGNVTLIR